MLVTTRWILRLFNGANWLVGALMLFLLLLSFSHAGHFLDALQRVNPAEGRAEALLLLIRILCAITMAMVPLAHILLTRLVKMLDSVVAGTPFASANIAHLRVIAWSLLAMNIVDLGYGAVAPWASARTGEYLGWSFGLTGWLAVILLFILARIFEQGAAMQDELEGTV